MQGESENIVYHFGSYSVEVLRRQVFYDGVSVPLTAKAFDTLAILIRRRGEVVTKDELIHAVWPDTIVEENNLIQQISALRKALGERVGDHKYIVTVPGRGYSFVASVDESSIEKTAPPVNAESHQQRRSHPRLMLDPGTLAGASYAVLFMLLIASAFVWSFAEQSITGNRSQSLAVLQFRTSSVSDEFLGMDISDTLRARLGSVQDLTLRPGKPSIGQDVIAAGRELNVDAIVTGSIQRDHERVRIAVEMVDVSDGRIVWGKTFDNNSSDMFELQDTIASEVANALKVRLSSHKHEDSRSAPNRSNETMVAVRTSRLRYQMTA
jgi:DNA-binding winged helix-turn-helix (wHTH) protein/TolB-like protein